MWPCHGLVNGIYNGTRLANNPKINWHADLVAKAPTYTSMPQRHIFVCQSWACYAIIQPYPALQALAGQMTYLIHEANAVWCVLL